MFDLWTEKSPITQDDDFGNRVHVFPQKRARKTPFPAETAMENNVSRRNLPDDESSMAIGKYLDFFRWLPAFSCSFRQETAGSH